MTETPAPIYALQRLAAGSPIRQAADESGLEVNQVVAALLDDWRKTRDRKAAPLTGPGWEPYLKHPSEKVVRAAERLRDTFAAEDAKAGLLAEKRRLEQQLARVKAQLSSTAATPKAPREKTQQCPDCGDMFANLGVHRARKHAATAA